MKVRRYRAGDWHRLCEIHDRARVDELGRANLQDAWLPLEVAAEREGLFDYDVLVADRNGWVLGFVAYSHDELCWLYVDPDCYREGIGSLLVQAVLAERPGRLGIEVLQGNDAALNFYKSIGFVQSDVVSGRMPGNEQYRVVVHCLNYRGSAQSPASDRQSG